MKSIWDIIKGTLTGINNDGSAKRATAAYFTIVLLTSLLAVYELAFWRSSGKLTPNSLDINIVDNYTNVLYSCQIALYIFLGLATVETITTLVKTFKGQGGVDKTPQNESNTQ